MGRGDLSDEPADVRQEKNQELVKRNVGPIEEQPEDVIKRYAQLL